MSRVYRIVAFAVLTLNQSVVLRVGASDATVNKYAIPRVSVFVRRVSRIRISTFSRCISRNRVSMFGRRNGLASKATNGPYNEFGAFTVLNGGIAGSPVNVPELQP